MKPKIYMNDHVLAGMTMKDTARPEDNNMALHSCENPERVMENRRVLTDWAGVPLSRFVLAHQTHSDRFHKVTADDFGRGADSADTAIPDTDALYTFEPGVLIGSFTADCVPVIFSHEQSGLIGVIHSGWQGTVKEITPKLFRHLQDAENCAPEAFRVQLGAALSQEKFEVDRDVYEKFKALGYADDFVEYNEATGKWHIDNQKTVEAQLLQAGIPADRIVLDRTCTFKSPDGFSYREDKKAGRHLSFIVRKTH
ncbi:MULTISPECIES: peptidoglycan editing factor PgeF [Bhargavaea]|uniref:Purine nucleoside phosphorylase n=1 Tax=Bhargavaea changchunensis TaxID=2134037 RepID=A0ABW2NJG8_9BACL|nr:peptidoglycan editing factor PgeF [Bhargavaea sp. CC-171006]